jgi:dihydrofolate reductase
MLAIFVKKSKNNMLLRDDKLPWLIKEELKEYNILTENGTVIMDVDKFEEIGRPIPNRLNLVISNRTRYSGSNIITVKNLEQALYLATENAFILGGASLISKVEPLVDQIFVAEVNIESYDGEEFPQIREDNYEKSLIESKEYYNSYVLTRKKDLIKTKRQ